MSKHLFHLSLPKSTQVHPSFPQFTSGYLSLLQLTQFCPSLHQSTSVYLSLPQITLIYFKFIRAYLSLPQFNKVYQSLLKFDLRFTRVYLSLSKFIPKIYIPSPQKFDYRQCGDDLSLMDGSNQRRDGSSSSFSSILLHCSPYLLNLPHCPCPFFCLSYAVFSRSPWPSQFI